MKLKQLQPHKRVGCLVKYPGGDATYVVDRVIGPDEVVITHTITGKDYSAKVGSIVLLKTKGKFKKKPAKEYQWIYKKDIGILIERRHGKTHKRTVVRRDDTDQESEVFAFLFAHAYHTSKLSRTQTKKAMYETGKFVPVITDMRDRMLGVLTAHFLMQMDDRTNIVDIVAGVIDEN